MPLNALILGNPWFFLDAADYDIRTFTVRIDTPTASLSLPSALYNAPALVSLVRESGFKPDLLFLGDESLLPWVFGIEEVDIPTVWYAIDSHIHTWHEDYGAAFDLVLFAQQRYRSYFNGAGHPGMIEYLPLFAPSTPPSLPAERTRGAVFVGSMNPEKHPERTAFFSQFQEKCEIEISQGKWLESYVHSRIVLNHASHDEVNFRVFEALYSGALLITNGVPDLPRLFDDGHHLVVFDSWNVEDAVDKVRYYLDPAHDKERARIAWEGHRRCIGNHLRQDRMETVAGILREKHLSDLTESRLADLPARHEIVQRSYATIANSTILIEKARKIYAHLAQGS